MLKHSRLISGAAIALMMVGGVAAAQNANIPIVTDKGPAGQATISTGLGARGIPESIAVNAQHGPALGGVSINTSGALQGTVGVQSGGRSAIVTGTASPNGDTAVGVGLKTTF